MVITYLGIINTTKTKTMTARRDQIYTNPVIKLNDTVIHEVEQFSYLGCIITYNNTSTIDIKKRITLAKQTFVKKNSLLTNKHLNIETKKKFIKTFVWSVLLYRCKTWTIRKNEKDRLEAMEMWIWRKMNKTSWVERRKQMSEC